MNRKTITLIIEKGSIRLGSPTAPLPPKKLVFEFPAIEFVPVKRPFKTKKRKKKK